METTQQGIVIRKEKPNRMNHRISSLIAILNIGFIVTVSAANPASSILSSKQQEDAREISSALIKRDALVAEVDRLSKEVTDRKKLLSELEKNTKALTEARNKLEDLKKQDKADAVEVEKLEEKVTDLGAAMQNAGTSDSLTAQIQTLDEDIKRKNAQITILLGTLTGQFSGEHSFKVWNSITFAILIGMVILGFFLVAFKDVDVRKAIFGGESGIQFVALFSIIIAIILFGISGILEGKELSALLGGLSGYILGRSTGSKTEKKPEET